MLNLLNGFSSIKKKRNLANMKQLRIILTSSFLLFSIFSNAQDKLIQLSGVVVSEDSLREMPFASVFNGSTKRGTIADVYGFFSLVVQRGDTLAFKYLGHKVGYYVVPDTLVDSRYSIIHMLQVDTIQLPEVNIYPWPSREAFAQAFIEMNPYDDDMLRAQKLLSGKSLESLAFNVSSDASISYGNAVNQMNTRIYTMGQSPVNNLMNPYAWASFLQKWRAGDLKRQ